MKVNALGNFESTNSAFEMHVMIIAWMVLEPDFYDTLYHYTIPEIYYGHNGIIYKAALSFHFGLV